MVVQQSRYTQMYYLQPEVIRLHITGRRYQVLMYPLPTPYQAQITFVAPVIATGIPSILVFNHTATNTGTGTSTITPHTVHVAVPPPLPIKLSAIVSPHNIIYETLEAQLHVSAQGGNGTYTYVWSQKSGVSVGLNQTDPQNLVMSIPFVTKHELIELQVVISDGNETIIKILPMTIYNVSLTITAYADALTHGLHKTHLHVVPVLSPPPSNPVFTPVTYHWSEAGGNSATINDADTDNPEIILPAGSAHYTFEVEGTDHIGNSDRTSVIVLVLDDLHVNAGNDFNADENTSMSLHGLSTGAYGAVTIKWTQTAGPSVTLTGGNTLNPKIQIPILGTSNPEVVTFKMEVTDVKHRTTSDTVEVTISPVLPTVTISAPTSLPSSAISSASCAVQGGSSPFTYLWSTSSADILLTSSSTNADVNMLVDAAANSAVILTCVVSDAHGRSVSATHNVSTHQVPPPPTPLALSVIVSISSLITENQIGILSAHAQGGTAPYIYKWHTTFSSSTLTIIDDTQANTSFIPPRINNSQGLTGLVGGFYVEVTDANNVTVTSTTEYLVVKDDPVTVRITGASTIILGQTLHLHATVKGGAGNYTYGWFIYNVGLPGQNTSDFTFVPPLGNLPLSVEVTDTDNGQNEVVPASHHVTVKP